MVGVVPLGTGNDLARVLGWGGQCSDEEKIPTLLNEMECSSYRLLDRWSVWFTTDTSVDAHDFVSFHCFLSFCYCSIVFIFSFNNVYYEFLHHKPYIYKTFWNKIFTNNVACKLHHVALKMHNFMI